MAFIVTIAAAASLGAADIVGQPSVQPSPTAPTKAPVPESATQPESTGVAAAPKSSSGVLDISIEQIGVGGFYRPGDPLTALRVAITSNVELKENVVVQWRVPDADGEVVSWERVQALTPGRAVPVWLYAPLPPSFDDGTVSVVQVYKLAGDRLGEEVGATRFSPRDAVVPAFRVELSKSMIAVVGRSSVGVEDYRAPMSGQADNPPWAHEETLTVSGIRPDELPDRWYPLQSFEAIIWSAEAVPQELRIDPAAALREYVQRGGHLVIVLPQVGDAWGWGGAENPAAHKTELDDLLPRLEPRRDQGVPLQDMIDVLGKSRYLPRSPIGKPVSMNMDIRVFKQIVAPPEEGEAQPSTEAPAESNPAGARAAAPFNAMNLPWQPLIALQDGRVVAIQRTYGLGRVSILGIDVGYGQLRAAGLPQADTWWNRVLGRRSDTPRPSEWAQIENQGYSYRAARTTGARMVGSGELIESSIRMSSVAGKAAAFAAMLFFIYFFAAVFGSFFALKRFRLVHHSWLAFVAMAGLFTVISWGSVNIMRGTKARVQHITVLDHVAETKADGPTSERQLQRAVSWMSVFLPGYGRSAVSIEPYEDEPNVLLPWHPPQRLNIERFPNVDRYRVEIANRPADYEVPGRATAKQFYANYLGPVAARWGEMFSVDPLNPVRVEPDPVRGGQRLVGGISHNLPGNLANVSFIWIQDQRIALRRYATDPKQNEAEVEWVPPVQSGRMLNAGRFWKRGAGESAQLAPGRTYSLQELLGDATGAGLDQNLRLSYFVPYGPERTARDMLGGPLTDIDRTNYRQMLGLFNQLPPPEYISGGPKDTTSPDNAVFHRELGRELDLSPWFNRPCLIIIGELRGAPCPVPIRVDGEPVTETDPDSLTIVRWICPLEVDETKVAPSRQGGDAAGLEAAAEPGPAATPASPPATPATPVRRRRPES